MISSNPVICLVELYHIIRLQVKRTKTTASSPPFRRQKTAAPTTSAAASSVGRVPQLLTTRPYFASKTSGIPNQSFMPAQLFAFAGT